MKNQLNILFSNINPDQYINPLKVKMGDTLFMIGSMEIKNSMLVLYVIDEGDEISPPTTYNELYHFINNIDNTSFNKVCIMSYWGDEMYEVTKFNTDTFEVK